MEEKAEMLLLNSTQHHHHYQRIWNLVPARNKVHGGISNKDDVEQTQNNQPFRHKR